MSLSDGGNLVQVLNYPAQLSQFELFDVFSHAGQIVNVHRWTGTNSCQIAFREAAAAEYVVKTMNGVFCGGAFLQLALGPYDADHRHVARFPLAQAPVNYNVAPFVAANPQVVQSFQPKAFGRTSLANNLTPKPNFDRRHSSFVPGRGSENDAAAANHCNAYILNLSLDMTNDALEKLCAEYGEVKHVCILATLDNAGRRRAFVDMSQPHEARNLIRGMNGQRVHGYEVHCSFAFVQRSGGPVADGQPLMGRKAGGHGGRADAFQLGNNGRDVVVHDEGSIHFGTKGSYSRASSPGYGSASYLRPPPLRIGTGPLTANLNHRSKSPLSSAASQTSVYSTAPSTSPVEYGSEIRIENLCQAAFIDSDDLVKLFASHGFELPSNKSAELDFDEDTGLNKGTAIVEFGSAEEAARAVKVMDGKTCGGTTIRCERLPAKFGKLQV